tara:strand:- start:1759 stop:2022 length:264 start_codon:yes stop_codon:yes gene_type:complete
MISDSDLIILALAFLLGFISNNTGPQTYEYKDGFVVVDSKYQCPKHCAVNHNHSVYYDEDIKKSNRMYVNKDDLGEKIKKNKRKNKR